MLQNKYFNILALLVCHIPLAGQAQQVSPDANIPVTPATIPAVSAYPGLTNISVNDKQNSIRTWIADQPVVNESNNVKHRQVTQFFDGLARPFQTVQKKAYSEGNDIVSQHTYDHMGRESRVYLPYLKPLATSNGQRDNYPNTSLLQFYPLSQGQQPYSETQYEASPLGRPLKQMAQGNSWVGSNRGLEMNYFTNSDHYVTNIITPIYYSIVNAFPKFRVAANGSLFNTGSYEAGTLTIATIKDEDGNVKEEVKDKKGRLLMSRILTADVIFGQPPSALFPDNYNFTIYVYDDLDQLRYVLPPGTLDLTRQTSTGGNNISFTWAINSAKLENLAYKYTYDAFGRVIEKKIPGKVVEYFVYDKRDRLVLSQDGNLRQSGKWMFRLYDGLNRPTVTALLSKSDTRASLQALATGNNFVVPHSSWLYYVYNYNPIGQAELYPATIPDAEMLAYTYYDNYGNMPNVFAANRIPAAPVGDPSIINSSYSSNTKGLVTATKVKVLDPGPGVSTWILTINYYNDKGRLIQSVTTNHLGGIEYNSNLYYYQGMPYQALNHHSNPLAQPVPGATTALNNIKLDKTYHRNLGQGGNEQVWQLQQTINDGTPYNLAYYEYDHMDRVVVKQYSVANVLQEYNIRGWIKQIHARNPMYPDSTYFRENLYYDDGFATKLFNGNIAGITWNNYGEIPADDTRRNAYGYSYDNLGRLTHAEFRNNPSLPASWVKDNKDYSVSRINYDERGNILTMWQRGMKAGPIDIDRLRYQYAPGSNQLIKVTDQVNPLATVQTPDFKDNANLPVEYTYDNNGNLLTDANKSITSITYNHLNMPVVITVQGKGTITYVYDAAGNKLRKTVYDQQAQTTEVWDYIGSFVYKNNVLQYILNEEGRSRPEVVTGGNQAGATKFVYDYFIKDHLGNVRTTLAAEPSDHEYYARHEIATANSEQLLFENIAAVRDDKPGGINMDDLKAARLNAAEPDRRIGTAIMLRVMPGDKFTIAADAYYETDEEPRDYEYTNAEEVVSSLLSTLASGTVGGKPVNETESGALINDLFSRPETVSSLEKLIEESSEKSTAPRAGLNYLFFDEQMNMLSGSGRLSVGSLSPGIFENLSVESATATEVGYILVYVDNQSVGKDVWFDDVQVLHYNTKVLDENHYYPFGLTISADAMNTTKQPHKYNGKELETSFDLQTYEYGARQYNSQIGRWNGIDPLADEYYGHSPFAYVANNPVKFIDPDGKRIVVSGDEIMSVISQLNMRYRGELSFAIDNGLLSAKKGSKELSEEANFMLEAVNNATITVNLTTISKEDMFTEDGRFRFLGEFHGNTVTKQDDGKYTVETKQSAFPTVMREMDEYYEGKPGTGITHEILESFVGGLNSQKSGKSATNAGEDKKAYYKAHDDKRVPKQSGNVYYRYYDKYGRQLEPGDEKTKTVKATFEKKGKPDKVIAER